MEENKLKIKCNVKLLKWTLTIFFLLGNLLFCAYEKEDMIQFLCFGIVINFLAIFSFVMLSIFPRCYYIFDKQGCRCQNIKGKTYYFINWEDVSRISYGYWFMIPDGLIIEFKDHCERKKYTLALSTVQVRLVYDTFPEVKEIIDGSKYQKKN